MDLNVLLEKYKNGDEKAFAKIYKETYPIIRALIYSYVQSYETIEDLCQDVYTKLDKSKANYNGNNAFSYIYTIAKNTALDYARKKKEIITDEVYFMSIKEKNPYLYFAISKLDEMEKEIFLAKVLCGHTTKKLAIIFSIKPSEVNKIYYLAKEKLKNFLGGNNDAF